MAQQNLQRRELRFKNIDDALAEARRLVELDQQGKLERVGKWSVGQMLGHLATWARFAFEGYPQIVRPPLAVRWVLRLMRNRILRGGMMSGVRLRGVPGGTVGTEELDADRGLAQFTQAMDILRSKCPAIVNPVFGTLTHAQWIELNLRHAELHMSFFLPMGDAGSAG